MLSWVVEEKTEQQAVRWKIFSPQMESTSSKTQMTPFHGDSARRTDNSDMEVKSLEILMILFGQIWEWTM